MKRETITQALGGLDDRFVSEAAVYAPGTMQEGPERIVRMKKKRFLSIVLAAALILALGITAYAAWSIHTARQEEIKTDLKIEENNVSSYAEYPVPEAANSTVSDVPEEEGSESELVLLSAVNAGEFQRVYVNISPVSEKCIADYPGYPGTLNFPGASTAPISVAMPRPAPRPASRCTDRKRSATPCCNTPTTERRRR